MRLRVLGTLELRNSSGEELRAVVAQSKRAALLAYLALAAPRGPHRRDTLVTIFWPEQDAEHARNALSQAVHFLRRWLGPESIVGRNSESIELDRSRLWCDAIAFEDALEAGERRSAVDLYHGELLAGLHVVEAPQFERWLDRERVRLQRRWADAVEALAEECTGSGDAAGALNWWRRLAASDPYSSRIALRLMRAMADTGDREGAIAYARGHDVLVREELDAPPDPSVARFVEELRAGRFPARRSDRVALTDVSSQPSASGPVLPPDQAPVATAPAELPRVTPVRRSRSLRWTAPHVWAVGLGLIAVLVAAASVALTAGANAAGERAIRSLAVLPLENLSGDSAQRSFAIGMHDELISELGRHHELAVLTRNSVQRYAGTEKPVTEIARELHVDGLVLGTLFWEGHRVRMNVQLVESSSGRPIWSRSFQRDIRDVLVLQSELAAAIAREVQAAALPSAAPSLSTGRPDSVPHELHLRELYLRGRHAELSRSAVGIQTAREAYSRAIALDSSFALGYAGLAAVYGFMADYAYAPMQASLDTARMMAQRAVALDSTLPETRTALAVTLGDAGQFAAAERELRRAIELGPSNARAHYWYSVLLVALGRGEEALREAERTLQLDPFAPRGATAMKRYAEFLVTGKRPHLKLPVTQRRPILKLEPGEPWARAREAYELAEVGKCDDARSEILRAQQLAPDSNLRMMPFIGGVHWFCGQRDSVAMLVESMKRRPDARAHGFRLAWLYTLMGEKDSAFAWLSGARMTMASLSGLAADQAQDGLRSDPRFPELLRRFRGQ